MPWWEMVRGEEILNDKDIGIPEMNKEWRIGCLIQIGYLLENEHGIWFGVGPQAAKGFNDLGPVDGEKK